MPIVFLSAPANEHGHKDGRLDVDGQTNKHADKLIIWCSRYGCSAPLRHALMLMLSNAYLAA
ncbi:MAG: hypothetical protein CMQ44_11235 [Gammaproteobacteria bacterium]|nr:hypothetical protein [Gammaproteobacteria bacterium]